MSKYNRFYPVNGCKQKRQGQPCGLKNKDEEGTFWPVRIKVPVDGEVANLVDGRPSLVDFVSQRESPDGERQELSKSLIKEVKNGNARCEMCGATVGVETDDQHVDESRSLDDAMEDHLRDLEKKEEEGTFTDEESRSLDDILGDEGL